jgi:hypothetical protein
MEHPKEPSLDLAQRILPAPLLKALEYLAAHAEDYCLVGGTALAGFYAGHRRSDDLDLFTKDDFAQKAVVQAILSLKEIGAEFSHQRETRQHFHCLCVLNQHQFTIDVVLDANFYAYTQSHTKIKKLNIATLDGLLAMKIATLVSRCSEKDLYDLIWLFSNFRKPQFSEFTSLGEQIDSGVNDESILISLSGSSLRESACHFSEDQGVSAKQVYEKVTAFKNELIHDYSHYLKHKKESFALKSVLDKLKGS